MVIIGNELILIVRPIPRIRVIDTEMNHGDIWAESQSLLVLLLLEVGAMPPSEQCRSRLPEVLYLVLRSQLLLQEDGVGFVLTVCESIAVGDAIADAGYADRPFRLRRSGEAEA